VTKVDNARIVTEMCALLSAEEARLNLKPQSLKLIPHIESTSGLMDIKEILKAGKGRFVAAAFGADDFTADFEVHRTETGEELDFARKYFALNCHA